MPEPAETHRSFTTFLSDLEDGELHADLTRKVQDIVAALHESMLDQGGKPKAMLTLKIAFRLDSGIVEVIPEVKATLPEPKRRKTVLYATPDNNLTRRNPKQQELPLRDVNRGAGETRTA